MPTFLKPEIIALTWAFIFGIMGIYLYVTGKLGQKPITALSTILGFAIVGGLVIGFHDKLRHFEGFGVEIDTFRQQIKKAAKEEKEETIAEIKQEVSKEKESVEDLIQSVKDLDEQVTAKLEKLSLPSLSLASKTVRRSRKGYFVSIGFKTQKQKFEGAVTFNVKLVNGSNATIIDISAGSKVLRTYKKHISADKKKANINYLPRFGYNPMLDLLISAKTKFLVSGSHIDQPITFDIGIE